MMKKKFYSLIALILCLVIVFAVGCTPTDPITDDIYVEGTLYVWDGGAWQAVGGGGAGNFTDLGDVDNDYTGDGGKYLRVTVGEDGIEFVALGGGGDMAKATYDTDADNIVDKAENVDDGAGNASSAAQVKNAVTDSHTHANMATLDATQEAFTTVLKDKLNAIEANADVTDSFNVDAAGATMNTDFNAKGDLLTATGDDTPVILSYDATDGHVLTIDTAQASGLKWAAPTGGSGAAFTVSGATVYNGNSPTSWTDLDLSGTVGSNSALVLLCFQSGADMNATAVRMNGDGNDYYSAAADANAYGCALGHHDTGTPMVLLCVTDSSGIIEWITETQRSCTVTVIMYIA